MSASPVSFSSWTSSFAAAGSADASSAAVKPSSFGASGLGSFPKLDAYQRAHITSDGLGHQHTAARKTRQVEFAIQEVRRLSRYGAGWDGYDAAEPNPSAIRDAADLLARLSHDQSFRVEPEPDGSISLSADGNGVHVLLTFEGNKKVNVALKRDAGWQDLGEFDVRGAGRPGQSSAEVEAALQHVI